ncbi:helix-turn-helix transcriptional regulator [Paenalcaligenes sp. Me131]|uniref:helix-turn-helix transcriptional regulator n=1 Tax=Paenalcaligenes sp. Me131 TaxID=3392636 RepID=UPI003D28A12A
MLHLHKQLASASNLPLNEGYRILCIKEVCMLLQRSKSMLYEDMNPNSKYYKPNFPKPIKKSARSIGWKAADVYAYIDSLVLQEKEA